MPVLHRDYETHSSLKLGEVGAWRYATHPETDVWCCDLAQRSPASVRFWGDVKRAAIQPVQSPGNGIKCNGHRVEDVRKVTAPPAPPTDVAGKVLAGEIRAKLSNIAPDDRMKTLLRSIGDGDETTIAAALGGPAFLTGLGAWSASARRGKRSISPPNSTGSISCGGTWIISSMPGICWRDSRQIAAIRGFWRRRKVRRRLRRLSGARQLCTRRKARASVSDSKEGTND